MEELEQNSKVIRKLCWLFIAIGLIEIFSLVFMTRNFLAIIPGLVTIIPSYFTIHKDSLKRGYFVGIWSFIKYNPISLVLVAFVLGDLSRGSGGYDSSIATLFILFFLLIGIISITFGIVLIIKIFKYNKLRIEDE